MSASALYFPYIDIRADWPALMRVLLYWDCLGSIIPRLHRPARRTTELIDAGLVIPVHPQDYVRSAPDSFAESFADLLEIVKMSRLPPSPPMFLHMEKADWRVHELLTQYGVATATPNQDPRELRDGRPGWMIVDGHVGRLYIAHLAVYLSQLPSVGMEPITDQRNCLSAVLGFSEFGVADRLDGLRMVILKDVLPSPAYGVSLSSLVDFKSQHQDLLRSFRGQVERAALSCASEPDPELRHRKASQAGDDLREQVSEVSARMEEQGWPTRTGIVCAVLEGIPGAAAAVASGHAAVAATSGVPLLIDYVRHRLGSRGTDAPPVYAVLAQREFV